MIFTEIFYFQMMINEDGHIQYNVKTAGDPEVISVIKNSE